MSKMTSDDEMSDQSENWEDDWDGLTFEPICDKHDYRCWSCGKPKRDSASMFGTAFTLIVMLLLTAIMLAPLLWLVRVTWSWAL